jgi:exodeoxyribonuclease-3
MKIISWNVNGAHAVASKGFANQIKNWDADIICLQETKSQDAEVKHALADVNDYNVFSFYAIRKGYSGTSILTKQEPISVSYGLGVDEYDQEDRVITAEFNDFYLLTAYIPNSGSELEDWIIARPGIKISLLI